MGDHGDRLHEWVYGLEVFRERREQEGGEATPDNQVLEEVLVGGVRLFGEAGVAPVDLERTRVIESPAVTHLRYRVVR